MNTYTRAKDGSNGVREAAQLLRALADHTEDPGSIPKPTWWLQSSITPVPENVMPSSGISRHQSHVCYM